ncbi:type I restriction endonuclease [Dyadobacter sp. 32]|uniref:type I restriction endonuclease n=1 Tax=Dyadobacter sp. 32 TaxID=538966 RepID=UPI0011EE42C3
MRAKTPVKRSCVIFLMSGKWSELFPEVIYGRSDFLPKTSKKSRESWTFLAVRQLWLPRKSKRERRPDIIGFVNGIPLLFVHLKATHKKL